MKKLNWNTAVKVKLNDRGKDIYYHQFDELLKKNPSLFEPRYPKVDDEGYTEFQLWHFMNLYGQHIQMGFPDVVADINFYIDEDLEEVTQK